ncbi:hypothetical protein MMC07_000605 [Pseudocyphellaria aurata]|nr:hypothetical protein [Pseudocyphellaria aurata]
MNSKYMVAASREEDRISNHHDSTKKKPVFVGWRFGIISGSFSVFVVLVVNLSFTLWTISRSEITNNRGILYDGHCDEVRRLDVVAHVMINIFSTVILASSNYCMQCLSAPTRAEIDKAHAQGVWLDIGTQSVRNLRRISGKRALVWTVLGLSSLPLHLLYNSVIFLSISTNNYVALAVNRAFIDAPSVNNVTISGYTYDNFTSVNNVRIVNDSYVNSTSVPHIVDQYNLRAKAVDLHKAARNSSLQPLNNSACIEAYAHEYLSDRSNLLLVTSDANSTSTPAAFFSFAVDSVEISNRGDCVPNAYFWICADADCNESCEALLSKGLVDVERWTIRGNPEWIVQNPLSERKVAHEVQYCLSQRTQEHCKLQFSSQIVIVVIVINTLKMVLMLFVVFGLNETPLMTIGDAVASFLDEEDPTTKGCCLVSKFDIKVNKLQWQYRDGESNAPVAKEWMPTKVRWARAVSRTRWWSCGVMISLAVTVCSALLGRGIHTIIGPKDLGTLWRLGVGAVSVRTLIHWSNGPSTLVGNVLMANLAQPILSFIYFTYNGIFTCMLAEREWNQFGQKRGGLRVTSIPSGSQRSSYFLQLPYRFAIPIMIVSGLLHWLVSQSIFFVSIETWTNGMGYGYDDWATPDNFSCGYSPMAIIFVIILAVFMMLFGIGMGMKRYEPGIPVAGNCSVVLSAACHMEAEQFASSKMASKPLQWGVVRSGGADGVGHCAMSDAKVTFPQRSMLYAGKS